MSIDISTPVSDLRVRSCEPLEPPRELTSRLPLSDQAAALVAESRRRVTDIVGGRDDRLLVVVGPCSVHDPVAALDYARRLAVLREAYRDSLEIVMRVYFEKPRTTVGWKGLINDPRLDGSYDIALGLTLARQVLVDVLAEGVPTAAEFLEPITPQYLADAVSWGAIGARTPASQVHRQLASGLSMAIGFKNATDGDVQVAVDGCQAAAAAQAFVGVAHDGRAALVMTEGNPDCHVVLRGGRGGPNFTGAELAAAKQVVQAGAGNSRLVLDASHGNSGKSHLRQAEVVAEIADQIAAGDTDIVGVMMESFLVAGSQEPAPTGLVYGQSVTDACLSWETTERLLAQLSSASVLRRATR